VQPRTHLAIDRRLCGEPLEPAATAAGTARVGLTTVPEMAADAAGLVHGGFVFGLADHAAMLAVNHPNVVLGSAAVRFLRPVAVGERLIAEATVAESAGRKSRVLVEVRRAATGGAGGAGASGGVDGAGHEGASGGADGVGEAAGETVMSGELVCFSLDRHVLEPAGGAGGGGGEAGDGGGEAGGGDGDGRRAERRPVAGA
jgi:acyl-coenzyme A thioesterase PaaI-like protein